jgi:hypothetical protein
VDFTELVMQLLVVIYEVLHTHRMLRAGLPAVAPLVY